MRVKSLIIAFCCVLCLSACGKKGADTGANVQDDISKAIFEASIIPKGYSSPTLSEDKSEYVYTGDDGTYTYSINDKTLISDDLGMQISVVNRESVNGNIAEIPSDYDKVLVFGIQGYDEPDGYAYINTKSSLDYKQDGYYINHDGKITKYENGKESSLDADLPYSTGVPASEETDEVPQDDSNIFPDVDLNEDSTPEPEVSDAPDDTVDASSSPETDDSNIFPDVVD